MKEGRPDQNVFYGLHPNHDGWEVGVRVFATQMLVLGLVRWELSCDDSRPVGTHIISTKNGALGRQAAVSGSGVGDSCREIMMGEGNQQPPLC